MQHEISSGRTRRPVSIATLLLAGSLAAAAHLAGGTPSAEGQQLPPWLEGDAEDAVTDGPLRVAEVEYVHQHPAMRRAHVRVRLEAELRPGDEQGDEPVPLAFRPAYVELDGERIRGAFWWIDGVAHDFETIRDLADATIDVRIPLVWRAGETYDLRFVYAHGEGRRVRRDRPLTELRHAAPAPDGPGTWSEAVSGGHAFVVREAAGLARRGEVVEFDLTVPESEYPDPAANVRATLMTAPGEFEPIPVQVYGDGRLADGGQRYPKPVVRFRAAVALDVPAQGERIVHLWHAPEAEAPEPARRAELEGGPIAGAIENEHYRIQLDEPSGQLRHWTDHALGTRFHFARGAPDSGNYHAMHYTPDVFDDREPWSHANDWVEPAARVIDGPVFLETVRHGPMPGVETVHASVNYRFTPARWVEAWSAMHVREDTEALALRNAGMVQHLELFTHAAWPTLDGSVREASTDELAGNDTGAPPAGRMPLDTPWVAFIHVEEGYGLAAITTEMAHFHETGEPVNRSGGHTYVSEYRGRFLYTLRALNINYQAHQRSKRSPITAGTMAYERTYYVPFSLGEREGEARYEPVIELYHRMRRPLVVMP